MRTLRALSSAAVVLVALTLAGCGSSDKDSDAASTPAASSAEPRETLPIEVEFEEPSTAPGQGTVAQLGASVDKSPEEYAKQILEQGEVEGIADGFSDNFVLPEQLTIRVVSGDEGPSYNPQTKTITLSYGFAILTGDIIAASRSDLTPREFGTSWAAVNDFILIHELTHAFIDVMTKADGEKAILVTGKEEDTADGLATYFFTNFVKRGDGYAFEAARFFAALQDLQGVPDATQYADEHSLSIVRAVDIACKVAGMNEQNYNDIAALGVVGDDRLPRCPGEFEQLTTTWDTILKPVRQDSD